MAYLTIGQMAELNNISKKSLLLYEEKGLLRPVSINEKTGYRYYSIRQCAKLDLIKYMQSLNFTLTEIGEALEKQDFEHLERMLRTQIENLEEERKRISVSLFSAQSYLRSIDCAKNRQPAGQYVLGHFPARKLIIFKKVSRFVLDKEPDERSCSTQEWEALLHDFRECLQQIRFLRCII